MEKDRLKILVIDVGGTHVKVLATGYKKLVEIPSGPKMTAKKMVAAVRQATAGWKYDAVSIGYPGPVIHGHPVSEPHNLGGGGVGFDYQKAFGRPVKIINDAAMQALGSYQGGKMLFLGLGTGLGSTMIVAGIVEPMECLRSCGCRGVADSGGAVESAHHAVVGSSVSGAGGGTLGWR